MRYLFLLLIAIISLSHGYSQNLDYLDPNKYTAAFDQPYGEYERNVFDIIIPNNNQTHGLIIYIHGGGFLHGDKKALYKRKDDIKYFIENNMAVATINYRFFKNNDSLGVKQCLNDVQRAIQYFRFHASVYNIDKKRIGTYGISAGAGSSLYFALHDDLAIPNNESIAGESTKTQCAAAIATQATYNVFRWKRIIPYMRLVVTLKRKEIYESAANFYGYPNYASFKKYKKEIPASLDMLSMIDEQDPPIYLMNLMTENFPKNNNVIQHHRKHAVAVAKKLKRHGVENHLYTHKEAQSEADIDYTIREFMVECLREK